MRLGLSQSIQKEVQRQNFIQRIFINHLWPLKLTTKINTPLEVGTKIRLAGERGRLLILIWALKTSHYNVEWSDFTYYEPLQLYPLLEIEDIPPPSRLISRVKEDIFSLIESITVDIAVKCGGDTWESVDELNRYLNSLEEVWKHLSNILGSLSIRAF